MILFDELKKLRAISADPEYTKRSRDLILAHTPHEHPARAKAIAIFMKTLRFGSTSLATSALIIVLIMGGIAASRLFVTPEFAGLDSATLKAEADQVDIQIHLAELGEYSEEVLSHPESTVTRPGATPKNPAPTPNPPATSTPLTLDEAFDLLAE